MNSSLRTAGWKKATAAGAMIVATLGVGGGLLSTSAADAATTATSTGSSSSDSSGKSVDESKSVRSDEQLLTGTTADKVTAAALAKYPGATIQRVETDSEGVYEAHVVTTAGERVIVQVGKDFAVTGTQQGRGGERGDSASGSASGSASPSASPSA